VERWPQLVIALEFDAYAFEALHAEDPALVQRLRNYVDRGRIEILSGTYSQPYSQLVGWASNVRQLVEGRKVVKRLFDRDMDTFLVEEIIFHPQMPQLLRRTGFRYASQQSQNNGRNRPVRKAVVNWRGLDGSEIPAIPLNGAMIPLTRQNRSFDAEIAAARDLDRPLITLWAEIWPPGFDWGASYLPYEQGIKSFAASGVPSVSVSNYMRERCDGAKLDSEYLSMDDAHFDFGWPQNAKSLWGRIGGWGYQGDRLLKQDRQLEHQLRATELAAALAGRHDLSAELTRLWKDFLVPQNHDFFIVSGFEAEMDGVRTTNLEAASIIHRKLGDAAAKLRAGLTPGAATGKTVAYSNPSGRKGLHPVRFHASLILPHSQITPDGQSRIALVPLTPNGVATFSAGTAVSAPPFYSIAWDHAAKGFSIRGEGIPEGLIFRPFTGTLTKVKESYWGAPNTGETRRLKDFSEATYHVAPRIAGPAFDSLTVTAPLLTLSTTEDSPIQVEATAISYRGQQRIDFETTLRCNPNLGILAFAELETNSSAWTITRDFPFGEEATRQEQFSSLHYVRLDGAGTSLVLAHDGTQQFFQEPRRGHLVLRNTVARETVRGVYRWRWSLTTGRAITPAQSLLFAQGLLEPVTWSSPVITARSLADSSNPAVMLFGVEARSAGAKLWLSNYSAQPQETVLTLHRPYRRMTRTDFDGRELPGTQRLNGRELRLTLAPWEILVCSLTSPV